MVIYAEYLFLENAIIGAAILKLVAKLGKLQTKDSRIVIGSIICGIFAFVIFIEDVGVLMSLLMKIGFSLCLAKLVFKGKAVKGALLIYVVSACMGGLTIILMYMSKIKGITNNTVLYIGDITYANVILGGIFSIIVLGAFIKIVEEKQFRERAFADVLFKIDEHQIRARALIDSGNFLKDPVLGLPVAVISEKVMASLKTCSDVDWGKRFCVIPYTGIGVKKGLLEAYRIDEAYIDGQNIGSIVVAIYGTEFCSLGQEEHYQVLLNKDCLLGGAA